MRPILFTGFPGFLGSALLPRLLRDRSGEARCVVQGRWIAEARRRVADIEASEPSLAGRIRLVEGDITRPAAGLSDAAATLDGVEEIFHLAAVYDLTVGEDVAQAINVTGTRHMLEVAERCPTLRRFHHVSTCYVSGRFEGVFREDDLDVGQSFKNHYEQTKFLAEVEVRRTMEGGLPATVYRPAVVVGDHDTGATRKLDGPYMFIRLIVRQGRVALLPVSGKPDRARVNIVPRDFVVEALATLSRMARSRGRTYHLADAAPETVGAMLDAVARAAGSRLIRVPVPLGIAKAAIRWLPGVARLTGVPAEALDYYLHLGRYDVTHLREDLAGTGIEAPPFDSYVAALVRFVRAHPELGAEAMV